jgi:pimeloyl-ACP methyl ester carboxylesterase
VTAALQYAADNPGAVGALVLRRVPPETYTVVPRPDTLTSAQRHALTSIARARDLLNSGEAAVLLAALAFGQAGDYANFREDHHHAEQVLKQSGLVHSVVGPHHARLSKDVMFSLRYCDDQHIADEGIDADTTE